MTDDELLQGLADSQRREDSELARIEASEPIDPSLLDRAVARAQAELRASPMGRVPAAASGSDAPASRSRDLPRIERRRIAPWIALAAAAAVVVGMAFSWSSGGDASRLPEYQLALLSGGAQTERALAPADSAAIPVRAGSPLDLVARPATRVTEPVEARAFLLQDGRAAPWNAAVDATPEGTVRVRGRFDDPRPLTQGRWALAIVVGPVGSITGDPSAASLAAERSEGAAAPAGDSAPTSAAWRVARIALVASSGP